MEILTAVDLIAHKFPLMRESAKIAKNNNNELINFVNVVLDQYYETSEQQERIIKMFGKEVMNCLVKWAKKEALRQEYFVMNECIKEDLR